MLPGRKDLRDRRVLPDPKDRKDLRDHKDLRESLWAIPPQPDQGQTFR